MKALYIGIQTPGTTSALRGDSLSALLPTADWKHIDTDSVFRDQPRWARSMAFRFRMGPAVAAVNDLVKRNVNTQRFDLVWIDKAVYLRPETVRHLRQQTELLIHYTPDTAFFANQSRFFNQTLPLYDRVVTTKSFELDQYLSFIPEERITLTTQSFDETRHHPAIPFAEKRREVVLIGLHEADRERCVSELIGHDVPVAVGGHGWERFSRRQRTNQFFRYLGPRIFGKAYTSALGEGMIGLGLLTKRFPELHTTRTFEIPACGTALATERNKETSRFFGDNEAIFFEDYRALATKIARLLDDLPALERLTNAGLKRVTEGSFSNLAVLRGILKATGVKFPGSAGSRQKDG